MQIYKKNHFLHPQKNTKDFQKLIYLLIYTR